MSQPISIITSFGILLSLFISHAALQSSLATGTLQLVQVLVTGGFNYEAGAFASAELYDPDSGTFTATGTMTTGRASHTATLLSTGRVLLSGGVLRGSGGTLASVEVYDPVTGTFSTVRGMISPRVGHQATGIPDGSVLITGGGEVVGRGINVWDTAERIVPVFDRFLPIITR